MSIPRSRIIKYTYFVIDGKDKVWEQQIRHVCTLLARDLEYKYDLYGMESRTGVIYSYRKLMEVIKRGTKIDNLIIDEMSGGRYISSHDIQELVAKHRIWRVMPIIKKRDPMGLIRGHLYNGIKARDIGNIELLLNLIDEGRNEDEAEVYYGIETDDGSERDITPVISDMVRSDIKAIKKLSNTADYNADLTKFKNRVDEEVAKAIQRRKRRNSGRKGSGNRKTEINGI